MKSNGVGLLLVSLLVIAATAIGFWSWSASAASRPSIPVGVGGPASEGAAAEDAQAAAGVADDAMRTEVTVDPEVTGSSATETAPTEPVGVHRVSGRVVDARGAGIEGARVGVADRDLEKLPFGLVGLGELGAATSGGVSTDADGRFALALMVGGRFRLVATHPEHPRGEYRGDATSDIEGLVIQLRDGARVAGRVVGAPAEVRSILVFSRRVEGAVEGATSEALFDLGDLVEVVGTPMGRSATVDDDRAFELRGLDPDERYVLWAANADESDRLPVKSTYALEARAGTFGVELIWREPLTVTVKVVDADTNAPLERLDVAAGFVKEFKMLGMSLPVPTTRTLRQKEFPSGVVRIDELEVLDGDDQVLAVEVRAEGRRPWIRHDIAVPRSGVVDLGIAVLGRAAVVVARVVAAETGEPIAGAEVELVAINESGEAEAGQRSVSISTTVTSSNDPDDSPSDDLMAVANAGRMSGTTDEQGECRITAEFDGRAQLRVEAGGYASSASGEFDLATRGEFVIDVPMHRGGTVLVTATDGHGAPAPSVFVQREGPIDGDRASERTDADGRLTFEALSVGEHTFKLLDVEPGKDGPVRIGLSGILDAKAGKPVMVADGEIVHVSLEQPLRGDAAGFVTLDGAPLDNASVRVFRAGAAEEELAAELFGAVLGGLVDTGAVAETDPDGLFELERIEVGDYRLVVNHANLVMPSVTAVRIVEGDNRVDVGVLTTTLRGRVVDEGGEPVARATVAVMPAEGELTDLTDQMGDARERMAEILGGGGGDAGVRTGSDGTFELRGVRAGVVLMVSAKARLHVGGSQRVAAVAEGSSRSGVEIVLRQAGRVSISAVGVRGALSAKLEWAGSADAPEEREGLLRRSRVTIDGLVPGRWNVRLVGMGLPSDLQPRTVEVVAGETRRVDFGR